MKLTIARKQTEQTDRRGNSEGVVFGLSCRLALDPHEAELVQKHRRSGYPLTTIDARGVEPRDSVISLNRLREGVSIETGFVSDAASAEEAIKDGCAEFKNLLVMLESYGGQEEIEY